MHGWRHNYRAILPAILLAGAVSMAWSGSPESEFRGLSAAALDTAGIPCSVTPHVAAGRVFWIDAGHPDALDSGPGTQLAPWRSPGPIATRGLLRPGDTVVFRAGLYRSAIRPATSGTKDRPIRFMACPGETVVISGVDPLNAPWHSVGKAWRTGGWIPQGPIGGVHDRHLIVSGGVVMEPVDGVEQLSPGTYFIHAPTESVGLLYLWLPGDAAPEDVGVEIGRRGMLFGPAGEYECTGDPEFGGWLLEDITFEHAANMAQKGAVCLAGRDVTARRITVHWTNGLGIQMVGEGHTLQSSRSEENGQAGISGRCTNCLVEDNVSHANNWKGHNPFWEAGGGKWLRTSGTVFRRHVATGNHGPGLWFDHEARRNVVEGAVLAGNMVAGLMLELNSDSNLVVDSRMQETIHRDWSGTGLLIQASRNNVIVHSSMTANQSTGIWVREDARVPTGGLLLANSWFENNATEAVGGGFAIRIDVDDPRGVPAFDYHLVTNAVSRPANPKALFGFVPVRDGSLSKVSDAEQIQVLISEKHPVQIVEPGAARPCLEWPHLPLWARELAEKYLSTPPTPEGQCAPAGPRTGG